MTTLLIPSNISPLVEAGHARISPVEPGLVELAVCRDCQDALKNCQCVLSAPDFVPIYREGQGENRRLINYLVAKKAHREKTLTVNTDCVRHVLARRFGTGQIIELRVPAVPEGNGKVVYGGLYNDVDKLVADVQQICLKNPPAIFTNLQEIIADEPRIKAVTNTLKKYPNGASAEDISRYVRLLIDIDAVRPSDMSSSDSEKASALDVLNNVVAFFAEKGFKGDVYDSGNSYHLIYALDLPATDENAKLVGSVLAGLAAKFNTAGAEVDTSVHDRPRIAKLPGTPVRKGEDTFQRPHRMSGIVSEAEELKPLPIALLQEIASFTNNDLDGNPTRRGADGEFKNRKIHRLGDPLLQHGEINPFLTSEIGLLRQCGLTEAGTIAAAIDWAEQHCDSPNLDKVESDCRSMIGRYGIEDSASGIVVGSKPPLDRELLLLKKCELSEEGFVEAAKDWAGQHDVSLETAETEARAAYATSLANPTVKASTVASSEQQTGMYPDGGAAALAQMQADYDKAAEQADSDVEDEPNPYPVSAWIGTPYYDFAVLCAGPNNEKNFIPLEYFINVLMTYVGAICGHRMVPKSNQELYAHFYTILLSLTGGIGKNETLAWAKKCFDGTNLLFTRISVVSPNKNIGAFRGDFASARGLIEKFCQYSSIIQEYGELSTAIEKFGIEGSGGSFLSFNLNAYDSNELPLSFYKGTKVPERVPERINNSIIAATTKGRWQEQTHNVEFETFMQRLNIVYTDEIRTVFELEVPDVTAITKRLIERVGLLEEYKLVWTYSPEAKAVAEKWHAEHQDRIIDTIENGENDEVDSFGRMQVYVARILSHMALWLAPLPLVDGKPARPNFVPETLSIRRAEQPDKIWEATVTVDMMEGAIQIAECLVRTRKNNRRNGATSTMAYLENQIIKHVAQRVGGIRWVDLKRAANLYKYGIQDAEKALANVDKIRAVRIIVDPEDPTDRRGWIIKSIGGQPRSRRWKETRGGFRKMPGRPSK